ncbi:hypothetical protein M407DRAFT_218926 [Tulasnella calospora MUT 4182]|uniref:C3H1-type domain-containing protein n=1 Tax=Tulasnella calospora MUT 4182 TaxID=1051891 RepID=A0A0C3Q9L0_9AGAM|nr:hypothetical protein M407DRAFT_218926 [Tulasnella calospora MUT 4182]
MSTPNPEREGAPYVAQNKSKGNARRASRPPLCFNYRSQNGCPKGDRCRYSHIDPRPERSSAAFTSQPGTPPVAIEGTSRTPSEPSNHQAENNPNRKPTGNWGGKGRGQLSPEVVREQASAQSTAAKAASAKKITIFLLGSVLSYSGRQADAGIRDPLKSLRGLTRFGDGSGSLQLDDVKAGDFDILLEGLRAPDETEFTEEELKVVLALASDWGFDDLRNLTMRTVETLHLSPIDRAVLARRCKITKWIRGALLSLPITPDPLNAQEIQMLGATTAAVVWRAREAIFTHRLQILTTAGRLTRQTKCHASSCKQALRRTMLRVLEQPGSAGKSETDLPALLKKEISVDEKNSLCRNCASVLGLGGAAREVAAEFQVARAVFEGSFGNEDTVWLEPA